MSIHDDALIILRVLEEAGAIGATELKAAEVLERSGLDDESYDGAENYLMASGYLSGTMGGLDGSRWLTAPGIQYLEQEMTHRLPISLDAVGILNYIIETAQRPMEAIKRSAIMTALGFDEPRYSNAVQELIDFQLVKKCGGVGIANMGAGEMRRSEESLRATQEGRQALRRGFRDPQVGSQINQVFNAPITAHNFQAVASAFNSQIEQSITENDPQAIREVISDILKELINQIQVELDLQARQEYTQAAAELEAELEKPDPEVEKIQKWLARLTLLEKGIEVSDKTISLIVKALPWAMLLANNIEKLLSMVAR